MQCRWQPGWPKGTWPELPSSGDGMSLRMATPGRAESTSEFTSHSHLAISFSSSQSTLPRTHASLSLRNAPSFFRVTSRKILNSSWLFYMHCTEEINYRRDRKYTENMVYASLYIYCFLHESFLNAVLNNWVWFAQESGNVKFKKSNP